MLLNFWFFFFCFEICLFTICARVWWKEHSCLLKVKGCVLLFLNGSFFYSRIERKQNFAFKRWDISYVVSFCKIWLWLTTLFFKDNDNWLFCFCKFCLCCVLFKYQKCGVDFGICVCLYYLKGKRMRKRKLLDVILFIIGFWLAFFLFKFKVWPFVWNFVYFWKRRRRGQSKNARFDFSWIWRFKMWWNLWFFGLEENWGECKERGCSFVDFDFLIEFFFQI